MASGRMCLPWRRSYVPQVDAPQADVPQADVRKTTLSAFPVLRGLREDDLSDDFVHSLRDGLYSWRPDASPANLSRLRRCLRRSCMEVRTDTDMRACHRLLAHHGFDR